MELWVYLVLSASAVLWGASDALMKRFSPPELQKRETAAGGGSSSGVVNQLIRDFWSLLLCPAYLTCLAANQVLVMSSASQNLSVDSR